MEYQSLTEITKSDIYKGKISKVSIVIVLSVLSFIYFLPTQAPKNPFLIKFFDAKSDALSTIWLFIIITISVYIIISFLIETSTKNRILRFELESKQEEIFCNFLNHEVAKYNGEFLGSVFSTQDLSRYIIESQTQKRHYFFEKVKNIFFNAKITNELVAMTLSETIVRKAENKKLIKKTEDFPTLSESYEILIEFMS